MTTFATFLRHFTMPIAFLFFFVTNNFSQTVYTFTGTGDWLDASHWTPGIPPNPLQAPDRINIDGTCTSFDLLIIYGTLDINSNATLALYYFLESTEGTLNINMGGTLENNSFVSLYDATLNIRDGGVFNNIDNSLENGGTVNIQTGGILENNLFGNITSSSNGNLEVSGLLNNFGAVNNNGNININFGGTIANIGILASASTITNSGNISGTGILVPNGTLVNTSTGTISPGTSPGRLEVTGDFDFDLGFGTYNCEINGTGQGTTYDWLDISIPTILTHANLIVDWGSFTPSIGDEFTILTCSNRTGEFNTVTIPTIPGLQFGVVYGNTFVKITVSAALPIELIHFSGQNKEGDIVLEWKVAQEKNNKGFFIQRSDDATNWDILNFVKGHGTTSLEQQYKYQDKFPLNGINYYRLHQIDFDGAETYSHILMVDSKKADQVKLSPNPVQHYAYIDKLTEQTTFTITNMAGQTLQSGTVVPGLGINIQDIPPGLYYLRFEQQVIGFVKE